MMDSQKLRLKRLPSILVLVIFGLLSSALISAMKSPPSDYAGAEWAFILGCMAFLVYFWGAMYVFTFLLVFPTVAMVEGQRLVFYVPKTILFRVMRVEISLAEFREHYKLKAGSIDLTVEPPFPLADGKEFKRFRASYALLQGGRHRAVEFVKGVNGEAD